MTPTYIKIANMIANNQIGTTVLFLYPIPNLRKLKSLLYIIDGLNAFIIPNNIIKIKIETILRASLDIKLLNIVIC
jgi:hypothetical protein